MTSRRIFNLPLICLLIISLLASSTSEFGYVWCFSTDGDHSALELAQAGDCSLDNCTPTTGNLAAAALTGEADDCGTCLDISSSHQWNTSRWRQDDIPVNALADFTPCAVAPHFPLPEWSFNTHRVVDFPPRIPEPIQYHRTTVLLI
jgi:hypothetical protein